MCSLRLFEQIITLSPKHHIKAGRAADSSLRLRVAYQATFCSPAPADGPTALLGTYLVELLGTARRRQTSWPPWIKGRSDRVSRGGHCTHTHTVKEKVRQVFSDTFFNETGCGRTRQGKHRLLGLAQFTADRVTAPSEPLHADINDTHIRGQETWNA